jgi:REP element-mobilizing transposase RayT
VHVTLRIVRKTSMRDLDFYQLFRGVLARYLGRDDFRIIHISIQHSHLHMIIEARDAVALSRGMQSFGTSCARRYNLGWGREGKVFEFRYHAKQITTPAYARHALSYVLNNWRRHRADFDNGHESHAALDYFSSAISFTGWTERFHVPADYTPLPVSPPRTSLLKSDWQWHGLISPYEIPAQLR